MVQPILSPTLVPPTLAFGQLKQRDCACELQKLQQIKCAISNYFTLTVIALCRTISTSSTEKVFLCV